MKPLMDTWDKILSRTAFDMGADIGVSINPGAMHITRIPHVLKSLAIGRVIDATAPFEVKKFQK